MDCLYASLDQCMDEDTLKQIRKNIRAASNFAEVSITEQSYKLNNLSNEPAISTETILFNLTKL